MTRDLRLWSSIRVRSLPAYLLRYGNRAALLQSFDYKGFVSVMDDLSGGSIKPQPVEPTTETLRKLLHTHPLISPIEVREAFDLADMDAVRKLIQPLTEAGEIEIAEVYHGWFIQLRKEENDE